MAIVSDRAIGKQRGNMMYGITVRVLPADHVVTAALVDDGARTRVLLILNLSVAFAAQPNVMRLKWQVP